jgi:hypothetical protein
MSTPDATRAPLLRASASARDESTRARATGPPLWLSLLVALAFAAAAAVVAAGVGMSAAEPADAPVEATATTASAGALGMSHRPARASRGPSVPRHNHVGVLGHDERDDDDDDHRRRHRRRRPDEASDDAPSTSASTSAPVISVPATVDLPGRNIHMRKAPEDAAFCATRATTRDGDWRGHRSAVFDESTLAFTWPDPDDVVAARRACKTPQLQALQDSGEFADAFCFLLRPPSDGSDHGRVAFDVDPVCASEYNYERHVVPAAPAFLEWVAARLTCEVTTVVRMRDVGEDDPPLSDASRETLEANGIYPLLREASVPGVETVGSAPTAGTGTPTMPDFTFLRSRGFRERAFGDVVLEDTVAPVLSAAIAALGDEDARVDEGVQSAAAAASAAFAASASASAPPIAASSAASAETARVRAAWRAKRRAVFWRGPLAGRGACEWTDRARLARDFFDVDGLDARVVVEEEIPYADEATRRCAGPRAATAAGLGGGFAVSRAPPTSAWTQSRGVVDVAGVGPDPERFLRLASDSVVLSLGSPTNDFLDDRAEPWVHYVPATFDTLRDRVAWIMDDDNEEAQVRMIVEAHKLAETITWEREAARLGDRLNEMACGTQATEVGEKAAKEGEKATKRTTKASAKKKTHERKRWPSSSSSRRGKSARLGATDEWFTV